MVKSSVVYECGNCGAQSAKWAGQCSECGKWNSLVEAVLSSARQHVSTSARVGGRRLEKLSEIEGGEVMRRQTGIGELDRVLGGGIVPGEVVLMIGEPGIGKSTLLTQLALSQNTKSETRNSKQTTNEKLENSKQIRISDFVLPRKAGLYMSVGKSRQDKLNCG